MSKMPKPDLSALLTDLYAKWYDVECTHVGTNTDYVITDFSMNVTTSRIDVIYCEIDNENLVFNRDWEQFQDGRFKMGQQNAT